MSSDESQISRQPVIPVKIGQMIQETMKERNLSVSWLSQQLNCDRRNVYDIFTRAYIDTGLLYRISLVLEKDFFKIYSEALEATEKQGFTPPPRR